MVFKHQVSCVPWMYLSGERTAPPPRHFDCLSNVMDFCLRLRGKEREVPHTFDFLLKKKKDSKTHGLLIV